MTDEMISLAEVIKILGISKQAAKKLVSQGLLQPDSSYLFSKSEVMAYLETQNKSSASTTKMDALDAMIAKQQEDITVIIDDDVDLENIDTGAEIEDVAEEVLPKDIDEAEFISSDVNHQLDDLEDEIDDIEDFDDIEDMDIEDVEDVEDIDEVDDIEDDLEDIDVGDIEDIESDEEPAEAVMTAQNSGARDMSDEEIVIDDLSLDDSSGSKPVDIDDDSVIMSSDDAAVGEVASVDDELSLDDVSLDDDLEEEIVAEEVTSVEDEKAGSDMAADEIGDIDDINLDDIDIDEDMDIDLSDDDVEVTASVSEADTVDDAPAFESDVSAGDEDMDLDDISLDELDEEDMGAMTLNEISLDDATSHDVIDEVTAVPETDTSVTEELDLADDSMDLSDDNLFPDDSDVTGEMTEDFEFDDAVTGEIPVTDPIDVTEDLDADLPVDDLEGIGVGSAAMSVQKITLKHSHDYWFVLLIIGAGFMLYSLFPISAMVYDYVPTSLEGSLKSKKWVPTLGPKASDLPALKKPKY